MKSLFCCQTRSFYASQCRNVKLCDGQLFHNVSRQTCIYAGCDVNGTAACKQDNMNTTKCICYPGYSVTNNCGEMDECKEHEPCKYGICVNTIGSFRCECLPGKYGDHCNKDDTSFNCTIGYYMDQGNCTDIDECTFRSVSPCSRGRCENTVGSYQCVCPPGWTGDRCNNDIQECNTSPCHNGNCTNLKGSFTCRCDPYWTGALCDTSLTTTETSYSPGSTIHGSTVTTQGPTHNTSIARLRSSKATVYSTRSVQQTSKSTSQGYSFSTTDQNAPVYVVGVGTASDPLSTDPDKPINTEDSLNVGLIAGCIVGGLLAVGGGVLTVVLVYNSKRRGEIEPDQNTVIEVEQQTTNNDESIPIKPGGHVVGIPRDRGYAMRTRFSIQRLFR